MNKDLERSSTSEKVVRADFGANASKPARIEQPLSKNSEILVGLRSALHEFLDAVSYTHLTLPTIYSV